MHLHAELLSACARTQESAQLPFWRCGRGTCSLFRPLAAATTAAAAPEELRHTRPAARSEALPSPHPEASAAQMLWHRGEGGVRVGDGGVSSRPCVALCGAVIATITITSSAKNSKQEFVLLLPMQRRINTVLKVNTHRGTTGRQDERLRLAPDTHY